MNWLYKEDKKNIFVFTIGCIAGVLCALPFVSNLIYSIDDYHLWKLYNINWSTMGYNYYSTGRPVEGVISEILYQFNLQPLNRPVGILIFIVSLALFGAYIGELLRINSIEVRILICLLIILNPFNTEIFYYSNITVYSGFAVLFLMLGLSFSHQYVLEHRMIKLLFSCIFYCLSLGVYQIFYPMGLFVFLLMIVRDYNEDMVKWKKYAIYGGTYLLSFLLFYIILNMMFMLVPPILVYEGINLVEFVKKLVTPEYYIQLFDIIKKYYGDTVLHSSLTLEILIIGSTIISVLGVVYTRKSGGIIYFIGVLLYLYLGPVMNLGFGLARLNEISARSFTSYGIYLSGLLAIDYYYIQNICMKREDRKKRYIKVLVVLFALSCIINGSLMGRVGNNIMRLNATEANMVNRIIYRMEESEEFTGYEPLAIFGVPMLSNVSDKSLGNLGEPASVSFSKVFLFNEISGYSFATPNAEQMEKAAQMAADMDTWPGERSVVYLDGMFVVRLYW